mgnify:FL=1|jgi:hypothetical protein
MSNSRKLRSYHELTPTEKTLRKVIATGVSLTILIPSAVASGATIVKALPGNHQQSQQCDQDLTRFNDYLDIKVDLENTAQQLIDTTRAKSGNPNDTIAGFLDNPLYSGQLANLDKVLQESRKAHFDAPDCSSNDIKEQKQRVSLAKNQLLALDEAITPVLANATLAENETLCKDNNEDRQRVLDTKREILQSGVTELEKTHKPLQDTLNDAVALSRTNVEDIDNNNAIDSKTVDELSATISETARSIEAIKDKVHAAPETIQRCTHPDQAQQTYAQNTQTLIDLAKTQVSLDDAQKTASQTKTTVDELHAQAARNLDERQQERARELERQRIEAERKEAERRARIAQNKQELHTLSVQELTKLLQRGEDSFKEGVTKSDIEDVLQLKLKQAATPTPRQTYSTLPPYTFTPDNTPSANPPTLF